MNNELKPCPFCGGEAHARAQHWEDGSRGWWLVECAACGAEGMHCDDREHAIEAWNTRAERTCKSITDYGYRFRFTCSACGYVALVHNCSIRYDEVPTYCPNCGAKVVGE